LTLDSFAYLRLPLALAAVAFLIGSLGLIKSSGRRVYLPLALMMILFCQAARLAMVAFDPHMSSRPLAEALLRSPGGKLIVDHHYYTFSSVFFYTDRKALLLNGRFFNFEYGSNAPGAPQVFIHDPDFQRLWMQPERYYLVAAQSGVNRVRKLVPLSDLNVVAEAGEKYLLTNHPLPNTQPLKLLRKTPT